MLNKKYLIYGGVGVVALIGVIYLAKKPTATKQETPDVSGYQVASSPAYFSGGMGGQSLPQQGQSTPAVSSGFGDFLSNLLKSDIFATPNTSPNVVSIPRGEVGTVLEPAPVADKLTSTIAKIGDMLKTTLPVQVAPKVDSGFQAPQAQQPQSTQPDRIDRIYQQTLGRNADASGREYYSRALAQGYTEKQVIDEISRSPEFVAKNYATQTGQTGGDN